MTHVAIDDLARCNGQSIESTGSDLVPAYER